MTPEEEFALALEISVNVHSGQFDKAGKPYILHPLWIANQLMFDMELAAIGLLHDVIEDSRGFVDETYLRDMRFSERIIKAVTLLTHEEEDSYEEYIDKICTNYDAIRVKRKDLEHNSMITRLKGVTERDQARMFKYHKAFLKLGEAKKRFLRT